MQLDAQYIEQIARRLQAPAKHVFLFWKGRVALYSLLKSLNIQEGDEVIIPAFTCVVVPNAIIYLGAKPIYVDIDTATLNPDIRAIKKAITSKTKCIVIQNTFGLSHQVEEIVALANTRSIYTIEDCTHGFGGFYKGKPNGSFCDAAFYSTQWNKPFSTGIGGFALLNNELLLPKMIEIHQTLLKPTWTQSTVLKALLVFKRWFLSDSTYWFLVRFYRSLSKLGWFVGSSSDIEIISTNMPRDYFMGVSKTQIRAGIHGLACLDQILKLRRKNGLEYQAFLKENGKWHYPEDTLENHGFLKYPILVKDRDNFLIKAEKSKIQLGDWFISPIHPVSNNFQNWQFTCADFPNAMLVSSKILNLPTDTKRIAQIMAFLSKNIDDLL
jgi:dTDP-4-amino-4,6-dideoxygalactose transaminase